MSDNEHAYDSDNEPAQYSSSDDEAPTGVPDTPMPDDSVLDIQEGEEVDLAPNAGIVKKLLRKGEGNKPPAGSEVKVHYVGTLLDGTKFDSSRDRGEYFTFKLGKGQVIKGWDKGVASMRKGELALLTCKPEYAYGKNGSPPKIPPDATLQFEIELFDWSSKQKVTEDGGVMKEILVEGKGYQRPNDDATVTVKYVGKVGDESGHVFDERAEATTIALGEDINLLSGFIASVKNMYIGEKSKFFVKPKYGYGAEGSSEKKVPANSNLYYEIEMVDFKKGKESWEMGMEEKLTYAEKKKEQANQCYKLGRLQDALARYQKALDLFRYEDSLPEEQKTKVREMKVTLNNNIAAARLKTKDAAGVLKACGEALKIEPHNNKALLRRARVYTEQHDDDLALADLQLVLDHADSEPSKAEANKLIAVVKKRIAQQKQKERDLFKNMFAKVALTDSAKENASPAAAKDADQVMGDGTSKAAKAK